MSEIDTNIRRSVRSTKGQHKALDQLDQPVEPKRRGRKKKSEEKQEPEEEIIRCVCGATEQDTEDPNEPWIACDTCTAWQHNICMGQSIFSEDLTSEYFCELCKPENHKELLAGVARGEKPWEDRRRKHQEQEEAKSKKGKKGKKAKGKRASEAPKDERAQTPASVKGKASPAPVAAPTPTPDGKEAVGGAGTKRKARDTAEEVEPKASNKIRKVSETQAVPVPAASPDASASTSAIAEPPVVEPPRKKVKYDPPADLPATISELPEGQQPTAKALKKSVIAALSALEKKGAFSPADGVSLSQMAERFAIQIERAVQDTHGDHAKYIAQIKTLQFNVKNNTDLIKGLLESTLSPPILATMTSDQMATNELKRETAEMIKRSDKQSILLTEEGPRIRKTHKGEELVEEESTPVDDAPSSRAVYHDRPSAASGVDAMDVDSTTEPGHRRPSGIRVDTQQSPRSPDFDIKKVFSKVRSPTQPLRRLSHPTPTTKTSLNDPEVDRLLQEDGAESPPYSPTEETDPDVLWKGPLEMPNVASLPVTSKFVGGGNLLTAYGLPWDKLFPPRLGVIGRLDEDTTSTFLCGMRWRPEHDVVVTSLAPATEASKPQFFKVVDYFIKRKRYGAVGNDRPNVVATYLVPVVPEAPLPELMLNLEDNGLPAKIVEPMLLAVFVYKNDSEQLKKLQESKGGQPSGPGVARQPSVSAPTWSPSTPQGSFPPQPPRQSNGQGAQSQHSPYGYGQPPYTGPPAVNNTAAPSPVGPPFQTNEQAAREILGDLVNCHTIATLLPQAMNIFPHQWGMIKTVLQENPPARDDPALLITLMERYTRQQQQQQQQQQQPQPPPTQPPAPRQPSQLQQNLQPKPATAIQPPQPQPQQRPPQPAPRAPVQSQTPIPIPHVPHTPQIKAPAAARPAPPPQPAQTTPVPTPAAPPAPPGK